jgi:hypothetical protein
MSNTKGFDHLHWCKTCFYTILQFGIKTIQSYVGTKQNIFLKSATDTASGETSIREIHIPDDQGGYYRNRFSYSGSRRGKS